MNTIVAAVRYDVGAESSAKLEAATAAADVKTAQAAALALSIASDASDEDGARAAVLADPRVNRLSREAAQAIMRASQLAAWRPSADVDSGIRAAVDEAISQRMSVDEIGDMVRDSVADAAAAHRSRSDGPPDAETRRRWSDTAGRTVATRLAAENVVLAAPIIEETAGLQLNKLWLTQTDKRVRSSHRHLQGKTAEMDKPFWRELGTDRQLRYPGDPEAPIEQTINCRCWMWLVPADQSSDAEETFHVTDDQFAMAAGGCGLLYGNAEALGEDAVDAALDALFGLTAATERNYDEQKHKRDKGGKFAKRSGGSGASTSSRNTNNYRRWLARGGYEAIKKKYGLAHKPTNDGSGGGGGGGGGAGKGDSTSGTDDTGDQTTDVDRVNARIAQIKEENIRRKEKMQSEREANVTARKNARALEDVRLIQQREGQDAALRERARVVQDVERDLRDHQREIEKAQNFILAMRLRGELPEIIQAERVRLAKLKSEASGLVDQSRALGTSDEVRSLRDRVRGSRRVEDTTRRAVRSEYDSRIRARQREVDSAMRAREREQSRQLADQKREAAARLREAKRARRASLVGGGTADSPQSCIIALIPEGDNEIEYESGEKAPAHLTLAYLSPGGDGIEDEFDAIDAAIAQWAASHQPFSVSVAGRATLGDDGDEVALVESDVLQDAREWAETDETCGPRTLGASTHPHWIPHLTGIDADRGDEVKFDRIGAWLGDDKREYKLGES